MPMSARITNFAGGIVAEKRGGARQAFRHDPLGSTIAVISDAGATTATYNYWPYGEVRSSTGSATTPWKFKGRQRTYTGRDNTLYVPRGFRSPQLVTRLGSGSYDRTWPRPPRFKRFDLSRAFGLPWIGVSSGPPPVVIVPPPYQKPPPLGRPMPRPAQPPPSPGCCGGGPRPVPTILPRDDQAVSMVNDMLLALCLLCCTVDAAKDKAPGISFIGGLLGIPSLSDACGGSGPISIKKPDLPLFLEECPN